ncbi:hypothetical protein F5Y05DRAFT_382334 [Hypoxylon sp. FL0543]|nr:hypothetical protein F5Y05DRAFT_382334 [Hypoxylon sp. FL0543]
MYNSSSLSFLRSSSLDQILMLLLISAYISANLRFQLGAFRSASWWQFPGFDKSHPGLSFNSPSSSYPPCLPLPTYIHVQGLPRNHASLIND